MKHFRRLGIWKPNPALLFDDIFHRTQIRQDFAAAIGLKRWEDSSVRGPNFHRSMNQLWYGRCNQKTQRKVCFSEEYPTTFWHRDGELTEDGEVYEDEWQELLMWSNRKPTEICLPNGRIVHGKSCEIVAFRNSTCLHRTPLLRSDDAKRRNFIRCVVPPGWTFLD